MTTPPNDSGDRTPEENEESTTPAADATGSEAGSEPQGANAADETGQEAPESGPTEESTRFLSTTDSEQSGDGEEQPAATASADDAASSSADGGEQADETMRMGQTGQPESAAEEPAGEQQPQQPLSPQQQVWQQLPQQNAPSGKRGKRRSRKKIGILVGSIAAALIIVGGGATAAYVFLFGSSAEAAAQRYVDLTAQETQEPRSVNADDYRAVVCDKAMPQIEQIQQQKEQYLKQANPQQLDQVKQVQTELEGVQQNGDEGTAKIKTTVPGQQPQSSELNLVKEDGDWKLCA